MAVENLPTLEEVTKQLEEANAKKEGKAPEVKEKEKEDPNLDIPPEVKKSEEAAAKAAATTEEDQKPAELPEADQKTEEQKPKDDSWSKKFAAMTRLDKKRRDAERALAQKQQEFEQRVSAFEAREAQRLKISNPIEALKHHGYSYEDAAYAVLGMPPQKEVDPVDQKVRGALDPMDKRLAEVQEKLDAVNKATEALQAAQAQQQTREIMFAIKSTADKGEYPYIQGMGDEAVQGVYDIMVAYYQKHKQYLTYKQACDRLEGYYKRIGSVGNTKKDTVPAATVQTKQLTESPQSKTLTQSHNNSGTRTKPNIDEMSDREAKEFLAKNVLKYR